MPGWFSGHRLTEIAEPGCRQADCHGWLFPFRFGNQIGHAGDFPETRTMTRKDEAASRSAPALYEAGLRHFHSGRLAVAEDRCRKALASDPQHADSLHLLGLIHAKGNRVDLAIDYIAQAIRSNQGNADYFSSLGSL